MNDMSTEEKQEFLDQVAGVEHNYRITIGGYGGEIVYSKITEAQYDYWSEKCNEQDEQGYDNDGAFGDYIFAYDEETYEQETGNTVPEEAKFEGEWYDQDDIDHTNGATFDSAHISIEKIDGTEYSAKVLEELYEYEDLPEFVKSKNIQHEEDELDLDSVLYPNGYYEEDEGDNVEGDPKPLDDGTMPTPYVMYAMKCRKRNFL